MTGDDVSLTVEEARALLNCSLNTMYRLAEKGLCGAYKLDPTNTRSDWRFPRREVLAHMKQRREQR